MTAQAQSVFLVKRRGVWASGPSWGLEIDPAGAPYSKPIEPIDRPAAVFIVPPDCHGESLDWLIEAADAGLLEKVKF